MFSAANRAARRKELNKLACSESGSFLEDVAGAEVEYGVHAQNWDNSGVPLEPFNLNQEREAGYFDEDGNYVAYCEAESDDAWLESLPQGTQPSCAVSHVCHLKFKDPENAEHERVVCIDESSKHLLPSADAMLIC